MKQKLLFLLASLLLPLAASAYDACINGIYYNIVKKAKQATVTYGDSQSGTYSGKVVIPATVEYDGTTCNVIAIGEYAFRGCALTSLSIPASITTIEYYAFENASINQLRINDLAAWCNITFGKYDSKPIACSQKLFINGKETTNLVIPDGVTKINDYAFYGAQMLNTITIPGSVTEIGHYAFYCEADHDFAKVTIDNRSLTAIGNAAFKYPWNTDHRYIAELHITDLAKWCSNVFFYDKSHFEEYGNYKYEYNNPLQTTEKFFVNGMEIKDLVIPNGVAKISDMTFRGAKMLTSVSIPNSVKEIGRYAFAVCTSLKRANIPDEVQVIDNSFSGCSSLKDLTIGCGVRKMLGVMNIGSLENIYISDLTAYCKIITNERSGSSRDPFVRIPKKQTPMKTSSDTRNTRLFLNGKEVKDLVIPIDVFDTTDDMVEFYNNMYYICDAFYGISSLTSVTIPQEVSGGIKCGIDYYKGGFDDCPNLKTIRNETNLQTFDISNCDKLETLVLGKYTKKCEVSGCEELADVYCAGMPIYSSFDKDCQVEYATLHVPEILLEKYRLYSYSGYNSGNDWKDFGNIVALKPGDPGYVANPDNTPITFADAAFGAAAIANWDFDGDGKLTKYEASLVTDFDKAFKNNMDIKTLDDLKYFTSMQAIGDDTFFGCSGITSVTIPSFITSIGGSAFSNCRLNSITIPSSVRHIGDHAFSTSELHIADLEAWCKIKRDGVLGVNHLYVNGKEVTDLVIPSSITHIKDYNFSNFTCLTSVTIPNSVTSIGYGAFSGCSGLTSVTIPNSVTSIGERAFSGCSGLTCVTIPNSVTSIAYLSFSGCSGLTSVTIPNSVTTIGGSAFSGCSGLTFVTIPNSVTSIGDHAFFNCTGLTEVRSMIEQPFAINDDAFWYQVGGYYYPSSATLYVPRGTNEKYQSTKGWKNFTTIIETDFTDEPKGDVNGDQTVDVADIASVIDVMAKGGIDAAADVNSDGVVDVADIATIISEMAARARMLNETEE